MNEFQKYLIEKTFINEKYIPYYLVFDHALRLYRHFLSINADKKCGLKSHGSDEPNIKKR